MIRNFDVIKDQLKELAGVINSFKSEAVQLRLIELVFEAAEVDTESRAAVAVPTAQTTRRRKPSKAKAPAKGTDVAGKAKSSGRPGGKVMLDRFYADGLFKKPTTIKKLVEHCEHNLALKYKQSDFSGALGRLTRDGKLKRTKNADNQYEYSQA